MSTLHRVEIWYALVRLPGNSEDEAHLCNLRKLASPLSLVARALALRNRLAMPIGALAAAMMQFHLIKNLVNYHPVTL